MKIPVPYLRRSVIAAAAIATFGVPGIGQAQTVTITSMAQAVCVGSCATVRFAVNLSGTYYSSRIRLWSTNTSQWNFGSVANVQDGNGTTLAWASGIGSKPWMPEVFLQASGNWAPTPIYVTTNMTTYSTMSNLYQGALNYEALVSSNPSGSPKQEVTGDVTGLVTPEPGTMLLLGTGLVGVLGAARRRRREGIADTV